MRQVISGAIVAMSMAVGGTVLAAGSTADAPAANAAWVEKDLSFTYMGFTSYYSCDGIQSKVRYVMKRLGARPGFKVTVGGCVHMTGPEIMPRVRVRAALPAEAAADAASPTFAAEWRTLQFRGTPTSDVQDGDCELLQQLVREVLVPMGVRQVAGSRLNCVPHQVPINSVNLKLQVLQPVVSPPARP
jgi:hypothetical protein